MACVCACVEVCVCLYVSYIHTMTSVCACVCAYVHYLSGPPRAAHPSKGLKPQRELQLRRLAQVPQRPAKQAAHTQKRWMGRVRYAL